ncbi:phospholipase/Carboxylesterase [Daldinia caldariorum]|uniref:phospholipase/Carboxylesterase n=1 Tax=Daldinia caldariorum TaxID=326644 RepID=UPI002007A872|nr:phospholipase/Carboxylesterase [Daldinia caldariorum]KAI1467711.1 phospholipase/Carboxylesterase [Daldinia caldariorum]
MPTDSFVVEPKRGYEHTHTVILLHGRGSTSQEFSSEFFESEASEPKGQPRTLPDLFPTIRWVFPSSPLIYSTRFECMESQWFDMWSTEEPNDRPEIQAAGLRRSIEMVTSVIAEEETKISRDKIFLGGISQGFAVAYAAYEMGENGLAGLIGFSSWAPLPALSLIATNNTIQQEPTNVFLGHCKDDAVIPIKEGRSLRDTFARRAGTVVEFHAYEDGGHWINEPQGVDDIAAFLRYNTARK